MTIVDYDMDGMISPADLLYITAYLGNYADLQTCMDAMYSSMKPILGAYP